MSIDRADDLKSDRGSRQAPALDINNTTQVTSFIRANTKVLSPPLVPEVSLYLAEESFPIWQKTEEDLQSENIAPPFWAFAWAGGQALARYLLDHREVVAGKPVLDIGTGSGLTAIAAMLAGADAALASDIDRLSIAAAKLNADLNDVQIETTLQNVLRKPVSGYDVIIVGDLFYERALAACVLRFCKSQKAQGATVLVGDPKRSYFPTSEFTSVALYEVAVTRELEDALIKKTSVWSL